MYHPFILDMLTRLKSMVFLIQSVGVTKKKLNEKRRVLLQLADLGHFLPDNQGKEQADEGTD